MPTLRRLEIFVTVARMGGISSAARSLKIVPSAVSGEVAGLEQEVGQPLFDRASGRWNLTSAGELIYRRAVETHEALTRLNTSIERLKTGVEGLLVIASSTSIAESLLQPSIVHFRQRYPGVHLRLLAQNSARVIDSLLQSEAEFALLGAAPSDERLLCTPFQRDQIVIVMPPHHPLAGLTRVSVSDVQTQPWITREVGSATRRKGEQCLLKLGVQPKYVLELSSNDAVKNAVRDGLGIAALSEHVISEELARGTLAVASIPEWSCIRWFCLARRRDLALSPTARAFMEVLHPDGDQFLNNPSEDWASLEEPVP